MGRRDGRRGERRDGEERRKDGEKRRKDGEEGRRRVQWYILTNPRRQANLQGLFHQCFVTLLLHWVILPLEHQG